MTKPVISVIMPVKNGSKYVAEALLAIKSQNADMEIILVDDGSSDNTAQIAESFGCIVLRHQISIGPVIAKNSALKIAKGKYIMFHDHDDVMNSGALLKMLKAFEEDEEIFAAMAQVKDFFSPELINEGARKIIIRPDPYFGLFSGAILMKREVFDVIGLFNEHLKCGEIIEWSGKMSDNNLPIKKLNFIAANRRIHNSNFGLTDRAREFKDYSSILRSRIKLGK